MLGGDVKLLDLILGSAGEGIYGLDCEGLTTFVNPAAARLCGYSTDELIGQSMHALLHHKRPDGSAYPAEECPIYAAFRDGKIHRVESEVFWRRDGTSFPVEYTSTPIIEDGRLLGAVVVFWDTTARKQAEENLQDALREVKLLKNKLEEENQYLREEVREVAAFGSLIGESPALQKTLQQVELVAPTDANVLIQGESGTGKELIARSIHEQSRRRHRPMIKVNCASIPRELFESEFFGHVKGAFTGALKTRVGRFQLADGGTIFLDEIGEIPLELQSKLLRVLQEGEFERVGDDTSRKVDVRVISASNRDLLQDTGEGRFRQDLYYRLSVFPLEVPPLRERPEDILPLAMHFAKAAFKKLGLPPLKLTHDHIAELTGYDWPGNVRELQHVIERAVIMSRGESLTLGLTGKRKATAATRDDSAVVPLPDIKRRERKSILAALDEANGKVYGPGGAARLLGVKPTTLASKMKSLGIERPR